MPKATHPRTEGSATEKEKPMPRWTTCDAKIFGVKLPTDVPASIQERAYTTSIWYTP